ncbi:MAG: Hsp33 family molecular chaperone HslO [Ruminococcus sp.]|nr:Hsp33 family molecular chaperone HslO [Ruminococcus sp.]
MAVLKRAISMDASAVSTVIDATDIVNEIEKIHKTSAVVSAGLGRLTIATSLIGYGLKGEDDSVTLRMDGNGLTGALICVSDSHGNVKSYVSNPVVEIPLNPYGKLDVKGAIGTNGTLSVIKDLGLKEPYSGTVPIVSGEVAEDIVNYFATSEQTPTVCALGVLVNSDLTIKRAGGFLIQLLPFASEEVISAIEKNIKNIKPITTMLEEGQTPEDIALSLLDGLQPNLLDEANPTYKCDCSKERVQRALISLGREELTKMANEQNQTEVSCHFCNRKYIFSKEDILTLCE